MCRSAHLCPGWVRLQRPLRPSRRLLQTTAQKSSPPLQRAPWDRAPCSCRSRAQWMHHPSRRLLQMPAQTSSPPPPYPPWSRAPCGCRSRAQQMHQPSRRLLQTTAQISCSSPQWPSWSRASCSPGSRAPQAHHLRKAAWRLQAARTSPQMTHQWLPSRYPSPLPAPRAMMVSGRPIFLCTLRQNALACLPCTGSKATVYGVHSQLGKRLHQPAKGSLASLYDKVQNLIKYISMLWLQYKSMALACACRC